MVTRPNFRDNQVNGDSFNMVETPEDSPERPFNKAAVDKEMGGTYNHMAQNFVAVSKSVRNLQLERNHSDVAGTGNGGVGGHPRVVEIDLEEEQRRLYEKKKT